MVSTDYDVVINGVSAKIKRGEDTAGYRERTTRQEVVQQLVSQSSDSVLTSRGDQRKFYQTSWSQGSQWWQPLYLSNEANGYFDSTMLDTVSKPGSIIPQNKVTIAEQTSVVNPDVVVAADEEGNTYAIGATQDDTGGLDDVVKWDDSTSTWVKETGYNSGNAAASVKLWDMIYDRSDGYFYHSNVSGVNRFNAGTATEDTSWLTGLTFTIGSGLFIIPNQGLGCYDGDTIFTIDKSGPTATEVFDDGIGRDAMYRLNNSSPWSGIQEQIRLAVSSPEGIYYVKNVHVVGGVQPWIFRVDRDASGLWIGEPIATLPINTVALAVTHFLGQLLVIASSDVGKILYSQATTLHARTELYSIDSQSGISVIGSPMGDRVYDTADANVNDRIVSFLGTRGTKVYLGGNNRIWIYDAARGGIHPHLEIGGNATDPIMHMFRPKTDPKEVYVVSRSSTVTKSFYISNEDTDNPDTVTAFGDDETHYTLISNYFDAGLPMELKELVKVELLREVSDGDQEWTVQVSADAGAFADALVHSTASEEYASATLTGTTGRRFRYKLIYQTKDTNRTALKALMFTFATGEMVTEYELLLDGTEFLNVDNETQNPDAFFDSMQTLAAANTSINFSNNYQEFDQAVPVATTSKVKVVRVEIMKSSPGEADVLVVLREL